MGRIVLFLGISCLTSGWIPVLGILLCLATVTLAVLELVRVAAARRRGEMRGNALCVAGLTLALVGLPVAILATAALVAPPADDPDITRM